MWAEKCDGECEVRTKEMINEKELEQVIGLWALSLPDQVAEVLQMSHLRDLKDRIVLLLNKETEQ